MTPPQALVIAVAVLGALATAAALAERLRNKRSLTAALVALVLRLINPPLSDKDIKIRLEKYRKANSRPYKLPRVNKKGVRVTEHFASGMQYFVFEPKTARSTVIYLHGGAYVRLPRISHIRYLIRLSRAAGVRVIMPLYPKAPEFTARKTVFAALMFYREMTEKYGAPVIMGDSSGGGLAMLIASEIGKHGFTAPKKLVLFSPWVDVSLDNPELLRYQRLDPLISLSEVKHYGKIWSADVGVKSPEASPLFESERHFPETYLFVGERELIYPDILRLHRRLLAEGVPHSFISRRGMNHVYQIYPIPEARRELKTVCDILK